MEQVDSQGRSMSTEARQILMSRMLLAERLTRLMHFKSLIEINVLYRRQFGPSPGCDLCDSDVGVMLQNAAAGGALVSTCLRVTAAPAGIVTGSACRTVPQRSTAHHARQGGAAGGGGGEAGGDGGGRSAP